MHDRRRFLTTAAPGAAAAALPAVAEPRLLPTRLRSVPAGSLDLGFRRGRRSRGLGNPVGAELGALTADGDIDMATCRAWMDAAGGMSVTFHRAFDLARDPERTMEDVVELGCERLLTSGQATDALAGAALIRRLTDQSLGRIKIMAGGGITAQNIAAVAAATGAREFHASARLRADARLRQAHPAPPGLEAGHWQTDAGEVRACIDALRALA